MDCLEQIELDLEMAQQGKLPPRWQRSFYRDLADQKDEGLLDENTYRSYIAQMERHLRRQQITDEEYEREQARLDGGVLLFYYGDDMPYTMIKVIGDPDGFTVTAFLDERGANGDVETYAVQVERQVELWAQKRGITPLEPVQQEPAPQELERHYETLAEALGRLLFLLHSPQQILC